MPDSDAKRDPSNARRISQPLLLSRYQPARVGRDNQLRTVSGVVLRKQAADVRLHRLRGEMQLRRDAVVGETGADASEELRPSAWRRLGIVHKPLTEGQLAVLRWVAEGRPKGFYDEGYEHRITARALERRGLVKVQGRGHSWTAALTVGGRYYLDHEEYEPSPGLEPEPDRHQRTRTARPTPEPAPIDDLVGQLRAAAGVLRLDGPTDVDRVSYRLAAEDARATGVLAFNERLKISGTKRGPLVVELLQTADADESAIAVPSEPDPQNAAVRAAKTRLNNVSDATRSRALTLIQAIADECAVRGWSMAFDDEHGFAITIGEDTYRCFLVEEQEKRDVYPDADIAERKYDWQRVSPTRMDVYSGRLRLDIGQGYHTRWWADRKRWTLTSKLPDFFDALDEMSSAERERRAGLAQAHRDNLARWEQAVPRARVRHLHALNAERAQVQLDAWKHANDLRAYADAITARVNDASGEAADPEAATWAIWLRTEADRVDPLTNDDQLRVDSPVEVSTAELDKYMPKGWTSRRPPDPPKWLPS